MEITTVTLTDEEFALVVKKIFSPDCRDAVSLCVMNMLADLPNYKPLLIKLAMDIKMDYKYKPGEQVLCDMYALHTWRWNKEVMRENGMITNLDQMVVTIDAVRPYKPEPYTVSYDYIPENEITDVKRATVTIEGMRLLGYAEHFPGD